MKKLRISRFVFFAVVILLLLSFSLSLLFRNLGVISVVSSPIRSVVARVDSVVSAPFRSLGSLNEDIHDLFSTYSENKKLKKKVAELENQSEEIASLKTENEQLNNTINASSSISTQFSATGKGTDINPTPLIDIVGDKELLVYCVANDMTGYCVAPNDYILHETQPYIEQGTDVKGRRHYHETNSLGYLTNEVIVEVVKDIMSRVK